MLDHIWFYIFQFKHKILFYINWQYDEVEKNKTKCIEIIPVPSSVGAEVFMTVL